MWRVLADSYSVLRYELRYHTGGSMERERQHWGDRERRRMGNAVVSGSRLKF